MQAACCNRPFRRQRLEQFGIDGRTELLDFFEIQRVQRQATFDRMGHDLPGDVMRVPERDSTRHQCIRQICCG